MRYYANAMNDVWFRRRSAELCLALALAPTLAWVEPFGVDEESFLARLGFWSGVLASWFIAVAFTDLWMSRSPRLDGLGPRRRHALLLALAALPMMFVTSAALLALGSWEASVPEIAELYAQILVAGSVVTMLGDRLVGAPGERDGPARTPLRRDALDRPAAPAAEPSVHPLPHAPASPLVARLPAGIRGPILCLEMQDHYVRVHTGRGAALLLMRLRDAIEQTGPIAGRQVHRSWWVADEAVRDFERAGRTGTLLLADGRRVPVSQRYLKDVETAYAAQSGLQGRN